MKYLVMMLTVAFSMNLANAQDVAKGKAVFKKVNCTLCHKADGMGKAVNGKVAMLKGPRIAGLDAKYIEEQLLAVQSKKRKNKNTSMMYSKIRSLKPQQIKDVAAYVSSLSKDKFKGMLQ